MSNTVQIPIPIKNKIVGEANWRSTNGHGGVDDITRDNFIQAAEFGYSLAAPSIAVEEFGDFVDWIRDIDFKKYAEGWCQAGGSNGWHCSTEELIKMFRDKNHPINKYPASIKEDAIGFAEWLFVNDYKRTTSRPDVGFYKDDKSFTTEQLYKIYRS